MFIFSTVLSDVTLHQPGLGVSRINAEDSIEEDLCDVPSFFRHRTSSVGPIDSNLRVIVLGMRLQMSSKKRESTCHIEIQSERNRDLCQDFGLIKIYENFFIPDPRF